MKILWKIFKIGFWRERISNPKSKIPRKKYFFVIFQTIGKLTFGTTHLRCQIQSHSIFPLFSQIFFSHSKNSLTYSASFQILWKFSKFGNSSVFVPRAEPNPGNSAAFSASFPPAFRTSFPSSLGFVEPPPAPKFSFRYGTLTRVLCSTFRDFMPSNFDCHW